MNSSANQSANQNEVKTNSAMIAWGKHWLNVGPKLEAIKTEELQSFDSLQQAEAIDRLLAWGLTIDLPPRTTSGLAEFHRAMKKLYS